jgi:DNA-binding NarL/FixJ family response regulator
MEDSSINDLIKNTKSTSLSKLSNDLIIRSIEDIRKLDLDLGLLVKKKKILINADENHGNIMIDMLKGLNFEINRIESYDNLDVVYFELSRIQYELVILTNTAMTATGILPVLPEIKKRFPMMKILIISGDTRDEYIKKLFDLKIDGFLPLPFMKSSFVEIVTKQFSTRSPSFLDKSYLLASRKNTPEIVLKSDGIIKITGTSISENATIFYEPILKWIEKYITEPANLTQVEISIDNMNGASKKNILLILQKITYVRFKNKKITINWYYSKDDDEMLQLGKEISETLDVSFNFIKSIILH